MNPQNIQNTKCQLTIMYLDFVSHVHVQIVRLFVSIVCFRRVRTNQQKSVGYAMMDHQCLGDLCSMKQFITRVVTNWWVLRCGPYLFSVAQLHFSCRNGRSFVFGSNVQCHHCLGMSVRLAVRYYLVLKRVKNKMWEETHFRWIQRSHYHNLCLTLVVKPAARYQLQLKHHCNLHNIQ